MNRITLLVLGIALSVNLAYSQPIIKKYRNAHPTSFAIVVDSATYQNTGNSIDKYQQALENEGLSALILIDTWNDPNEIRDELERLYHSNPPLEGAVFIGDIPIPMLRDAQHLTSAFKMDQQGRFSIQRSSVPSDRFYEDFDLRFSFIKQDSSNELLFYYSLNAESAQTIKKEIYSGRIRPPVDDESKYSMIENYLKRVVRQKAQKPTLSHAMTIAGHGYHSEALSAWEGELLALREQFPQFYQPGGSITNLYHSMRSDLKQTVLRELENPDLDLALFHAHGGVEAQYLLGDPPLPTIAAQVEAIKFFLRGKLRAAKRSKKSIAEVQSDYIKRYNIPPEWFEGAFDDSLTQTDSLAWANRDIEVTDIETLAPQPELIVFDECFNGAFHHSPYIAGQYVFGNGNTIAAIANSVNVMQDIWADEFLGLLGFGLRVGLYHRMNSYLESHIIGDPTFAFHYQGGADLNHLLIQRKAHIKHWKSLLKSDQVPLRRLAIHALSRNQGSRFTESLLEIYRSDPSFIVRLAVLRALAAQRSPEFEHILFETINDPYELVRRKTVSLMGDIGNPAYIAPLLKTIFTDPAKRVAFNAQTALEKIDVRNIDYERLPQTLNAYPGKESLEQYLSQKVFYKYDWIYKEVLPEIKSDSLQLKKRIRAVRYFRNYRLHRAVPELIEIAKEPGQQPAVRVALLEALGWFTFSNQRLLIISACDEILAQLDAPADIHNEALKTKNRLHQGANHPLTP
ncbi:HEAT repeat domain-containing protein [candidate division KSB1 bacterium]|nr:HEAT repeat domain-containing protein [candidate division KSB1 bacterium]